MRYHKKLNLTQILIGLIEDNQLKLQCGQWVTINGKTGRYVGRTPSGSIWISWKPSKTFIPMKQRFNTL